MENTIKCPCCKNDKIVKRGYFETAKRGKTQRYYCKKCDKKFVSQDAFYRMRNNPQKITLCLDLFYRGISTRKVQEHLQAFYPHNSDHSTILRWIWRYSKMISNFTDNLKLNVGSEIQADEIEYHRRKSHRAKLGIEQNWFVDVMDTKTRYIVSSDYMHSRTIDNLANVLKVAKRKTGNQVDIITTDGLKGYPRVLRKAFGLSKYPNKSKITHNVVIASERGFNYPIERLHNNIRQRTKVFRGFHGSIKSARLIMKGFEVYYNFITKHQGIECCPYEIATDLRLNSNNKWLELILLSSG